MTQRFFVTADGGYAGAYDGPGAGNPFAGLAEVPVPPAHGAQVWNGQAWAGDVPPAPLLRLVVADRMIDAEVATVAGMSQSADPQERRWWIRWVSAVELDPADPATVAGFEAAFGAARAAELLAPEGEL